MLKPILFVSVFTPPVAWLLLAHPILFAVIGSTCCVVALLVFIYQIVTSASTAAQPEPKPEPVQVEVRPC